MIGQTVGKYRVLDRIGRGGMGTVYRALDETLDREVAIKVLNPELNDPEVARRFRAEAVTVARLNHPGIATIYELLQRDDQWLMIMEFVRGETLEHLVERTGPLSPERASEMCQQVLGGLAHAHRMGVVHRDLKPANLMLTDSGTVKIMDFGIARVAGTEHLTNAGYMMGTPAYMAPEQVLGQEVDARTDLYAMGVVLYRLTTGKLPFKGDTPFAMAQAQVKDPPTPVRLSREGAPPWVDAVVARSLAKVPAERFQTADEFRDALQRAMAGLPLEAPATMALPPELVTTMPLRTGAAGATGSTGLQQGTPASAGPAAGTGATGAAAAPVSVTPAAGSGGGPATVTLKKRNLAAIGAGAAALILLLAGFAIYRARSARPEAGTTPPGSAAETGAPSVPEPQQAAQPEAAPSPAAPPPVASAKPASAPSPPPGQASAGGPSTAPASAGGRAAAVPPAPATSAPASAAAPAPAAAAPAAAEDAPVTFVDVKLLTVTGKKSQDQDVTLNMAGGQMVLVPKKGGAALKTLSYRRLAHVTYVHARDPKWDESLAGPPADLEVSGSLFRSSTRHWLTLQTRTDYCILRLTDDNYTQILQAIEARTGVKIDRQAPPGK